VLRTLSVLQSLMVHSVNLRESEIQLYAQSGLSIAHCPATLWKYVCCHAFISEHELQI